MPAREFAAAVIDWQRGAGRHDLPWQASRDAYRVWLSEIMLQQTQVATVIPYFARFLEAFPDLTALAAAPLERVLELWSGLGYYSRARHLHACARLVCSDFGAVLPDDPGLLAQLPGIGRSTAAAIAVFAYGRRAAILDGNVKRVLCRVFGVEGLPDSSATQQVLWRLADELLPADELERYTQGLMDLGATLCTTRAPDCARCPLRSACVAFRESRVDSLPTRKGARIVPERRATLVLLHRAGEILLEKRRAPGIWGGLWSLPQIDQAAATGWARDLALQHGEIVSAATLAPLLHSFTHYRLNAEVLGFDLALASDRRKPAGEALWLDLAAASGAALPAPIKRLLQELYKVSPWHGAPLAA